MFIIFNVIGLTIFLFLFWKRLKEDYLPTQIFSSYFYMLFSILISYFLSIKFLPNWWFWITFVGFLLGLSIGLLKFKLKFFETYESAFLGLLISFSLYLLGDSVKNLNIVSFLGFVVSMVLIGIFQYIDMHYKNISWYKSGKVGFSGLTITAIFFLTRIIVSIFYPQTLSILPNYEIYISSICVLLSLALTYNLSRS